ncbi:MAG TPA: patatin-like protein [Actinomycetota bacterium]|nr:patatin-like protein [Actinomycetota bacterium]
MESVQKLRAIEGAEVDGSTWRGIDTSDYEEVRFAAVMNGGVSLAIWMGGVAMELNLVTSRTPDVVYGDLLEALRSTARVDVISGTSAGGVNGGFLALATVHGTKLSSLGALWADKGGLFELLRSVKENEPPSLMRGDEYFLPSLRQAYEAIRPPEGAPPLIPADEAPIHLTITTSVINGRVMEFRDDFGQPILEVEHRGQFVFERGVSEDGGDHFAGDKIVDHLALASRSTASFPLAFEASFVPIGSSPSENHPNMGGFANFQANRFVVDGGVLVNQPIGPALNAIYRQSAEKSVRRILAYVAPDPGHFVEAEPDVYGNPPKLARVMTASLLQMPQAQTIIGDLQEIQRRNRESVHERDLRPNLLVVLANQLVKLRDDLFSNYQSTRLRKVVAFVADSVRRESVPEGRLAWTYDELVEAFDKLEEGQQIKAVPARPVWPESDEWDWGITPLERAAAFGIDLLRSALFITPFDETETRTRLREARGRFHDFRRNVERFRQKDTRFWRTVAAPLPAPPADPAERRQLLTQWAARVSAEWPPANAGTEVRFTTDELKQLALQFRDELAAVLPVICDALAASAPPSRDKNPAVEKPRDALLDTVESLSCPKLPAREEAVGPAEAKEQRVEQLCDWIRDNPPKVASNILLRLLALEVVYVGLSGTPPVIPQDVDLIQVSGNTPNGFDGPDKAKDKLAGVQLNHFGAFYKKSWRVSDWIWGRVDGATRLVQALLSPARLRQLGLTPKEACQLIQVCAGLAPDPNGLGRELSDRAEAVSPYLESEFAKEKAEIEGELGFLESADLPLPPSLPAATRVIARREHLRILKDEGELARLAEAVEADRKVGGVERPDADEFASRFRELERSGRLTDEAYFDLFRQANVGAEHLKQEAGSRLFTETTSRTIAVGAAALDVSGVKLGPARLALRVVHVLAQAVYRLVGAAGLPGRAGRWLASRLGRLLPFRRS